MQFKQDWYVNSIGGWPKSVHPRAEVRLLGTIICFLQRALRYQIVVKRQDCVVRTECAKKFPVIVANLGPMRGTKGRVNTGYKVLYDRGFGYGIRYAEVLRHQRAQMQRIERLLEGVAPAHVF